MKWITRERARVDRIACPWLISRFIDPTPMFLFVSPDRVLSTAAAAGAVPFDVPDVELGHRGDRCSFDAFLEKYQLTDKPLEALAAIVRGADTDARHLTAESAGLYALATGFQAIAREDHDNMTRQFPAYDALYAYCRGRLGLEPSAPAAVPPLHRVLFVCLHGAAKSVLATKTLERLSAARGLRVHADFRGAEPDPQIAPAVVAGLRKGGIDLGNVRPRQVTAAEIAAADRVVTFGCDVGAPAGAGRIEAWDDVPAVSHGYERAHAAIETRVARLVDELADRP